MEPLSKEEIEELENTFSFFKNEHWQRLFFTARLGAEYERQLKQTAQKGQP